MTGLFGGVDLGTPADRNKLALTRELESRRKREDRGGRIYKGGADYMLRHGSFYAGRELPERYGHLLGEMNRCFWNAMEAAEADRSLRYCEGLVGTGGGIFLAHAWCLDPEDGVLELTYPPEMVGAQSMGTRLPILPPSIWSYWGVVFAVELARIHEGDGEGFPMLGRDPIEARFYPNTHVDITDRTTIPLLDIPYDPARTTL